MQTTPNNLSDASHDIREEHIRTCVKQLMRSGVGRDLRQQLFTMLDGAWGEADSTNKAAAQCLIAAFDGGFAGTVLDELRYGGGQ